MLTLKNESLKIPNKRTLVQAKSNVMCMGVSYSHQTFTLYISMGKTHEEYKVGVKSWWDVWKLNVAVLL